MITQLEFRGRRPCGCVVIGHDETAAAVVTPSPPTAHPGYLPHQPEQAPALAGVQHGAPRCPGPKSRRGSAPELHGNGLAVWQTPGPAPTNVPAKVYGRQISQSGGFGPKTLLSSDGRYASTATTPSGDISVAWQQSTARWPIQARFGP